MDQTVDGWNLQNVEKWDNVYFDKLITFKFLLTNKPISLGHPLVRGWENGERKNRRERERREEKGKMNQSIN